MRAFAAFLGLLLVAFAAVALLAYPAWTLLYPHFGFPFHRVAERVGMAALAVGFVLLARRLKLADRASLGYGLPRRAFVRELGVGLVLGLASMLAVVALMAALGLTGVRADAPAGAAAVARLIGLRLLSALAVGFIEETFLRGAMHSAIARESGTRAAVLLTALLYAATHFFAKYHIAPGAVDAGSGLALLAGSLQLLGHPAAIADAFLALFAVGVLLGLVRAASGNIAACIGLHAGWVWVMLVAHELTAPLPGARWAFLLSRFDGFVGWLVLGWTVLLAVPLWRLFAQRTARQARAG
jgi:uncharacterized protein